MTREQAIQEIESLFPADSSYPGVRAIGIELLEEAKRNTSDWRSLPDETIFEYARLCRAEEHRKNHRAGMMMKNQGVQKMTKKPDNMPTEQLLKICEDALERVLASYWPDEEVMRKDVEDMPIDFWGTGTPYTAKRTEERFEETVINPVRRAYKLLKNREGQS